MHVEVWRNRNAQWRTCRGRTRLWRLRLYLDTSRTKSGNFSRSELCGIMFAVMIDLCAPLMGKVDALFYLLCGKSSLPQHAERTLHRRCIPHLRRTLRRISALQGSRQVPEVPVFSLVFLLFNGNQHSVAYGNNGRCEPFVIAHKVQKFTYIVDYCIVLAWQKLVVCRHTLV